MTWGATASAGLSLDTVINLKTHLYLVRHPTTLFSFSPNTFKELRVITGGSYAFREPKQGGESLPKPSGGGGKGPPQQGAHPLQGRTGSMLDYPHLCGKTNVVIVMKPVSCSLTHLFYSLGGGSWWRVPASCAGIPPSTVQGRQWDHLKCLHREPSNLLPFWLNKPSPYNSVLGYKPRLRKSRPGLCWPVKTQEGCLGRQGTAPRQAEPRG